MRWAREELEPILVKFVARIGCTAFPWGVKKLSWLGTGAMATRRDAESVAGLSSAGKTEHERNPHFDGDVGRAGSMNNGRRNTVIFYVSVIILVVRNGTLLLFNGRAWYCAG